MTSGRMRPGRLVIDVYNVSCVVSQQLVRIKTGTAYVWRLLKPSAPQFRSEVKFEKFLYGLLMRTFCRKMLAHGH